MKRKNKIEASLSEEKLKEFTDALYKIPGVTLSKIQEQAKKYGITISLMAAKTFKDNTFESYLARLRKTAELAQSVANARTQNPGATLADAAADLLAQEVFEALNDNPEFTERVSDLDPEKLAFVISSLRKEDRKVELLRLQHEKFKLAEAQKAKQLESILSNEESKRRKKKGEANDGLSLETINSIRSVYGLAAIKSDDDKS